MALTISKLKMWKDPKYTKGCLELPPAGSKRLPPADYTFSGTGNTLRPRRGSTLTALELPLSFTQVFDMSYLYIEASDGLGSVALFGWIDTIEQTATAEAAVLIRWNVDWWRSYAGSVSFGFGLVRRRPKGTNDPIQKVPYRYKMPGDGINVMPNGSVGTESYWCIVSYVEQSGSPPVDTAIKTCCFPVSKDNPTELKYVYNSGAVQSPAIKDVIKGDVSSALSISPSTIVSAFISPLPPYLLKEGTGTSADPYKVDTNPQQREVTTTREYKGSYITGFYLDNNGVFRYYNLSNGTTQLTSLSPKYTQGGNSCSGNRTILQFRFNNADVAGMMYLSPISVNSLFVTANGITPVSGDRIVIPNVYTVARGDTDGGYPFETQSGDSTRTYTESLANGVYRASVTLTYDGSKWVNPYDADPNAPGLIVKVITNTSDPSQYFTTAAYTTTEYYDASEISISASGTMSSETQQFVEYQGSTDIITTDTQEWVVTDMTGHNTGSIPWGFRLTDYTIRTVVSAVGAYLQIRGRGLDSSLTGMEVTIPLQPIDIASNSWSDYVYSGQRDYDTAQRKIANERSFEDAMMGTMGSTVSNTIFGALSGKGAVAAVSGVSTAISGMVTANLERERTDYWNSRLQEQDDMLRAKQLDNIMIPGGGWDWLWHGRTIQFVPLSPDTYSVSTFTEHVNNEGITVSEPTANCSALIGAGGPLQIDSLTVTGSAPPQAKQNIIDLLQRGVRIIEYNPSGVVP